MYLDSRYKFFPVFPPCCVGRRYLTVTGVQGIGLKDQNICVRGNKRGGATSARSGMCIHGNLS